jgi:hypothetical protein
MYYAVSWNRDVTIKHGNSDYIKICICTIAVMIDTRVLLKWGVEHINFHQVLDKATEHWFSQCERGLSGSVQTQSPNQQGDGRDDDARAKQGPPPRRTRISTGSRACRYRWEGERNK